VAEGHRPLPTVYVGEALGRYGFGESHPFGPGRLHAFWNEACRRGLDRRVHVAEPVACGAVELTRFHTPRYVEEVRQRSRTGNGFLDQGDTPVFPGMFEAGCHVVGSGLDGLAGVLRGDGTRRVFVPIGGLHHGRRDGAAGFCVFNDIGVLIETLRLCHGIRRVAYVDIDAHHGDGVFYAFEDDPDLCFADIH
jgi:acetoin utilization protein AcuC